MFLNLFAYTGTASVHAAVGGALSTTTVDMSNTYLTWAKNNMRLNVAEGLHDFIQADCLEWLAQQSSQTYSKRFDLIFLDPPTFSNSKRMQDAFDVQNHHVELIRQAASLLTEQGVLYFSTNFRRFKLDEQHLSDLTITDISKKTVPLDFARTPKIHYCWRITKHA
ncbi:class I SAM-dependent methyltransferase [Methylocucumis oryzae]|uniref:class I SAM-dependent methyltransferase n=1 Tax=Methylocucumis oryzae TaxID=1632867 RepID=UPI0030841F51